MIQYSYAERRDYILSPFFEKTEKKLLTNGERGGIIYELSREGSGRRKAAGEKSQKGAWQSRADEI